MSEIKKDRTSQIKRDQETATKDRREEEMGKVKIKKEERGIRSKRGRGKKKRKCGEERGRKRKTDDERVR